VPRYERQGECNRCGICCLAEDCQYFEWGESAGNKIGICTVFGKPERYARCVNFPAVPPIMILECSYRFLDTQENRVIGPREI